MLVVLTIHPIQVCNATGLQLFESYSLICEFLLTTAFYGQFVGHIARPVASELCKILQLEEFL